MTLFQCSLYGAIGVAISPLVHDGIGLDLPWWGYALAAWAVVGVLGVLRVDFNGSVLAGLLLTELALIVVYDVTFLVHPAHGFAWSTWSPGELARPGVGAILAIAVLGFVGFESAVVFSEESRQPRRTIPTATYLSLLVITAVYGISAWAMTVATGTDRIADVARAQGPEVVFALASAHLGGQAGTWGHALFATSIIAAMVSFHGTTARYVFALGREGVLPAMFGRTSTSGAPRAGSLAQTGIGLAVIICCALAGVDPLVGLFYTASTSGAFGVLILLVLAGIAVLGFFIRDPRAEGIWRTRIAPAASLLALIGVATLVLANFATLLGVAESSPLRWGVPAAFALTGLAGTGYGFALKTYRPEVYAVIGHGAKTALTGGPATGPADPDAVLGGLHPHHSTAMSGTVAGESWTNGDAR